ncbi:hypothetical protein DTO282E5_1084 [Paecilomyces variotii]|nr:hypothetical protein DTO282E5_1084 [Paecilomyces variotii]
MSALSLQTVIGTTTTNPNGFSSHEPTKSFALCAGSATILAEVDSEDNISQRFFRARPTATPINPVTSFYNQETPPNTPESRARSTPASKLGLNVGSYRASPSADGSDTWSSRERIKAVTSVDISPNGRFLAVGETGYNPRVLIFSTAKDSPLDTPLTAITDHSYGIRGLAFSPTSQYLATLGDVNDGFLFVWAVSLKNGTAKLHSANKCTSFVRAMCWMGQCLITVGVRHIKVWRLPETTPSSPTKSRFNGDSYASSPGVSPKALSGRNCVLSSLSENTFTCAASISDTETVVCSDTGAVCLLDDSESSQKLSLVKYVDFSITSMAVDFEQGSIWLGGPYRKMEKLLINDLRQLVSSKPPSPIPNDREQSIQKGKRLPIVAMGFLTSHIVTVDASRAIHVCPTEALNGEKDKDCAETSLPAHKDAVLGIGSLKQPNTYESDFFTWSCSGAVKFWNAQGRCQTSKQIELDQLPSNDDDAPNELKVLQATEDMEFFVSGDRYGVLRVISAKEWKCISEVRAHGAEITDIAVHTDRSTLIASSGRDRMVQLFNRTQDGLELIQTLDDHVGAVGQLLFMNDGDRLLSCSADRTVIIREKVARESNGALPFAFIMSKVITLKASPVSMTLAPDDPDILILSTIDRHIQRFEIPTGKHIHSFRASDPETGDTVVMGSLAAVAEIPGQSPKLLLGVSTTDKSIRVYDLERGVLLNREFGHTEGVSGILLLESQSNSSNAPVRSLISTGLDGIVMIWGLHVQQQEACQGSSREEEETPVKELTAAKPPLRRILSKGELAGLQKFDSPTGSPTPVRDQSPPAIPRRPSRYSLAPPSQRCGHKVSTPPSSASSSRRSPTSSVHLGINRRSPSPPSPRVRTMNVHHRSVHDLRRSSMDLRARTKSSEFGSLNSSTEQVCRTLRAYRKKLHGSSTHLRAARELQQELDLTLRALGERIKREDSNEDTETESSGKENDQKSSRAPHRAHSPLTTARRVPSTPSLRHSRSRELSRAQSLETDGEG